MTAAQLFNPFPGLRPFRTEEDCLFFGREEQTAELLSLLRQHRFLAVVGTSGSGKSSLVRAGLIPALHRGTMSRAGSTWKVTLLRPGGDPLHNLASTINDAIYEPNDPEGVPRMLATLRHSSMGLVEAYRQSRIEPDANLLVIVDQFEELFRFQRRDLRSRDQASAFVKLLLEASRQKELPIFVVLTMRSDYLGDCSQFFGLAEAVNEGEYLIPRLKRDQLRTAIEGPVGVGGSTIAKRLVQHLLNSVGDHPDQLPILQHALMRTWEHWEAEHRDAEPLDLRHYEAAGGMELALSRHADEIYEQLPGDRHRLIAEKLFQALTEGGSDNRGIRRPMAVDRLCDIIDASFAEVAAVIDAFRRPGRTFLMPMHEVPLTPQTVVDISHESLMRVWKRLGAWVEDEARSARIYRRLGDTAALHEEGKAGLYRDPDLQVALAWYERIRPNQAWADRYYPGFDRAIRFLEASRAARQAEEESREAARRHELEQAKRLAEAEGLRAEEQRRSAKRLRRFAAALGVAAVLASAAGVAAFLAFRQADQQRNIAQQARERALQQLALTVKAERAAQDARTAAEQARDETEVRAYTASLAAAAADLKRNDSRMIQRRLQQTPQRLRGWEWDYLWCESDRSLETPITLPPDTLGYHMQLSGDGTLLAARPGGGHSKPVKIYDTRSGKELATIDTFSSNAPLMTFSADNRLLCYSHWGTPGIQIYEIPTGRALVPENLQRTYNSFLGFDRQGARAMLLDQSGTLRVFKTEDWSEIATLPARFALGDISSRRQGAISPNGKLLVVGAFRDREPTRGPSRENSEPPEISEPMRIFNLETNELEQEVREPFVVTAVRFDNDGKSLNTVTDDGTISRYAVDGWKKVSELRDQPQRRGDLVPYRLDGRELLLSFDSNGSVAIFNDRVARMATLRGHAAPGESIAVDEGRSQIVTAHADGSVHRWDLRYPKNLLLSPESLAVTSDGSQIYVGIMSGGEREALQVCNVDVASATVLGYLRWYPVTHQHSSSASGLALSPDGRRVAVATHSGWGQGRWRIYDAWTGVADYEESPWESRQMPWYGDLSCIDWSPDGKTIALGGDRQQARDEPERGRVRIYDAHTFSRLAEMDDHEGPVNALSFSHDSQLLVTAADDGTLRAWNVPHGSPLNTFTHATGAAVNCVAFASDDSYIAAGTADGTIIAWNPRSGNEIFRSQVHGAAVTSVAFIPDGSRLATAASDRSLKIWDPVSWRELVTLHLDEAARAMRFSPDGRRLLLAGRSLAVLDAEPETLRSQQRQQERENRDQVRTLVQNVLDQARDAVQARERLAKDESLNAATRAAALRELCHALDTRWRKAYEYDDLETRVTPILARHVLGEQLLSQGGWIPVAGLIAKVKVLPDVDGMQRQALAEFAAACRMGSSTNELAWTIALDPGKRPEEYALATFGMEALVKRYPDAGLVNTLALAQYRAGLFQEALESAQRSERLSQRSQGSFPHNVSVIAMAYHRMGQSQQTHEAMEELDKLMQQPKWARDPEAIGLRDEARQVVSQEVTETWDEGAAWDAHRARLEAMNLNTAKYAGWLIATAKRLADRNLSDRAEAWSKKGIELQQQLQANP